MTQRTLDTAQDVTGRPVRPGVLVLCVLALVAGFGLSAALTAPLAADLRLEVGEWGAVAVFAAAAVPLAVVDARTLRLPNRATFPLAAGMLGYWIGMALTTGQWQLLIQAVLTAGAVAVVALVIALVGTLAAGDVKLMLAIGLLAGWFSWLLPLYVIAASYLLALPHAAIILARRRQRRDTRLPFGPYLVAAAVVVTVLAKLLS